MKPINWSWTKFIVGISMDKTPNFKMERVWVIAIHVGFLTIIISPSWNK